MNTLIRVLLVSATLPPVSAHAAFWDRPLKVGYTVGVDVVVNLGPLSDRSRIGLGAVGQYQRFWADSPYWSDGSVLAWAPLLTAAAQVGWTHPVVFAQVTGTAGPMYPMVVGDGGFMPLVGAQVGAGLGLATDGSSGPILTGAVLASVLESRVEITRWKGWHAPKLTVGPRLSLTCCSYYL